MAAKIEHIEREIESHNPPMHYRTHPDKAKRNMVKFHLWTSDLAGMLDEKKVGPRAEDKNLQHDTSMLERTAKRLAAKAQLLHGAVPLSI